MKDLLLYPFAKLKYNWVGLVVMLICGIYLAIQEKPSFLIGIGIGLVIVYLVLIIYKLLK